MYLCCPLYYLHCYKWLRGSSQSAGLELRIKILHCERVGVQWAGPVIGIAIIILRISHHELLTSVHLRLHSTLLLLNAHICATFNVQMFEKVHSSLCFPSSVTELFMLTPPPVFVWVYSSKLFVKRHLVLFHAAWWDVIALSRVRKPFNTPVQQYPIGKKHYLKHTLQWDRDILKY